MVVGESVLEFYEIIWLMSIELMKNFMFCNKDIVYVYA